MFHNQQIVYVNSRNRTTGTDSDFTHTINLSPNIAVNRAAIVDISIPKTYYNIPLNYNEFDVTEESVYTRTISLVPGNYTRTNLASNLQALLNDNSLGLVYTVTFPPSSVADTGLLTFTVTGNMYQPIFIFDLTSPWEQMGFYKNTSYTFSSNSLVSTGVMNLNNISVIYLHSTLVQEYNSNIFENIYSVNSPGFSFITFTNFDIKRRSKPLTTKDSNNFRFWLLDDEGIPIDLNGNNVNMVIMLFQFDDSKDLLSKYIRFQISNEKPLQKYSSSQVEDTQINDSADTS